MSVKQCVALWHFFDREVAADRVPTLDTKQH